MTRTAPALLALLLTGSLVGGATGSASSEQAPATARAASRASDVGTPGMGDPYFPRDGNGGIDVLHYDVRDTYAFGPGRLTGRTNLRIRATQALSRFDLDFLLPVQSITIGGQPATFDRSGDHELRITPAHPLTAGEQFSVVVTYSGIPASRSSQGESNWLADDQEVVAMNEPHMATWWFPANDHPRDKATYDVRITAPADKQVVGNGVLMGRTKEGTSATTHWRSVEPMASYLAFFAAGPFETRSGEVGGRPYYVAVSRQIAQPGRSDAMTMLLRSGEITAWLESVLGPYPFSTTGGLVTSLPVGFALENQTRPTYPRIGTGSVSLLVHELAHQWFGDSVSVANWRDIWLNEGFAQFMETYYDETHGGRTTQQFLESDYAARLPSTSFWSLQVDDPGAAHIFDNPVYERGAMALAALRHRIGDPAFWSLLQTWTTQHHFGNGAVPEFEALAESVSGQDLDGFFTAWLTTHSAPAHTAANGF